MSRRIQIIFFFVTMHLSGQSQVTFVLEHLPHATPPTDSIFISGTFNDWKMSPEYMFRKRLDGRLTVTVPDGLGDFEYKFTRGTWAKAETDENNAFRPNRLYAGTEKVIEVSIHNWQDVGGARSVSVFVFYFFTMAFVFLVTRHFLVRLKSPQRALVNSTLAFQILISTALLGRVALEVLPPEWTPYFIYSGQLIVLICCVTFLDITVYATGQRSANITKFIPAGVLLLYLLLKIINIPALMFLNGPAIYGLTWDTIIVNAFLLCNLVGFYSGAVRLFVTHNSESSAMTRFLKHHIILGAIFMLAFIGIATGNLIGRGSPVVLDNLLPFCASLFIGGVCWFALNRDEVFRVVQPEFRSGEIQRIRRTIDQVMQAGKLYLNPNLTLNDLADSVGIKPHALSRVLNEGLAVNFRDLVNSYRVEEFIRLATLESSKRYTFLALAYEVGFNSKSTFNAAFKKSTQMSPREYFNNRKVTHSLTAK